MGLQVAFLCSRFLLTDVDTSSPCLSQRPGSPTPPSQSPAPGGRTSEGLSQPRRFLLGQLMSASMLFLTDHVSTESGPVLSASSFHFRGSSDVISSLGLVRRLLGEVWPADHACLYHVALAS